MDLFKLVLEITQMWFQDLASLEPTLLHGMPLPEDQPLFSSLTPLHTRPFKAAVEIHHYASASM